jgi:hypothetical protein
MRVVSVWVVMCNSKKIFLINVHSFDVTDSWENFWKKTSARRLSHDPASSVTFYHKKTTFSTCHGRRRR